MRIDRFGVPNDTPQSAANSMKEFAIYDFIAPAQLKDDPKRKAGGAPPLPAILGSVALWRY